MTSDEPQANALPGKAGTAPTLVQRATAVLRDEILRGELAPNSRVHLAQTAARLNMSAVPVREALGSLVGEGLVRAVHQRGFRVARLHFDEVNDIYNLRFVLDPLAVLWAVPRLSDEDRDEIRWRFNDLSASEVPEVGPARDEDKHRLFHFAIYDKCGSDWLLRFLNTLWDFSQRYQLLSGQQHDSGDHRTLSKLHVQILDACLSGDAEAAAAHTEVHLRATLARIQQYARENPQPAEHE